MNSQLSWRKEVGRGKSTNNLKHRKHIQVLFYWFWTISQNLSSGRVVEIRVWFSIAVGETEAQKGTGWHKKLVAEPPRLALKSPDSSLVWCHPIRHENVCLLSQKKKKITQCRFHHFMHLYWCMRCINEKNKHRTQQKETSPPICEIGIKWNLLEINGVHLPCTNCLPGCMLLALHTLSLLINPDNSHVRVTQTVN